jgi:CheY-like chemotaxis protein
VHHTEPPVVLVVEDDGLISHMTASCLRDAGYLVLELASGDAAVSLLRQGGHFDVLVTDINLGRGLNGWDVADAYRARHPRMPIIYASGNPIEFDRCLPDSLFLPKPYNPEDILNACRNTEGNHSWF